MSSVLKYPVVNLPKHMTSSNARKILKLQEEEKRRAEIVKAAKQHQKINKRTQAPKRPHTAISKTSKSITSKDSLPSRKSSRPRKAKSLRMTLQLVTKAVIQRKASSLNKTTVKMRRKNSFVKSIRGSIRMEDFGCSATNVNSGFMQDAQI